MTYERRGSAAPILSLITLLQRDAHVDNSMPLHVM